MDNLWQKLENIVAKGEIARFVQFLLLSLWFLKSRLLQRHQKASIWGKGLRGSKLVFSPTISLLLLNHTLCLCVLKRIVSLKRFFLSTHNIGFECQIRILEHEKCPLFRALRRLLKKIVEKFLLFSQSFQLCIKMLSICQMLFYFYSDVGFF